MSKLETSNHVAGIVSALIAAATLGWAGWTYFHASDSPSTPESVVVPNVESKTPKRIDLNAGRQKRFMDAWEAATYAQGNVKRPLSQAEKKLYDDAYQRLRDGMHLGEQGVRDDEALQAYRESREMFERLKK